MKKLISLLLIICMLFPVHIIGTASGDSTLVEKATDVLAGLGIMENFEDGSFHGEYKVSRGETVKIIYSVVKETSAVELKKDKAGKIISSFSDLDDSELIEAAETVKELGFISGFPDGSFKPDEAITFIQFIKIVVKMLGFDFLAEKDGGYPHGYINQAGKLDLFDSLVLSDYNQNINRGSVALILYNALRSNMLEEGYFEGDNTYYTDNYTETAFYRYMGINYAKGFVLATPHTALSNRNAEDKEFYNIDGERYKVLNHKDYTNYIGLNVEYYYYDEEVAGVKQLLYIRSDDYSDKQYVKIKSENLLNFSHVNREYSYTDKNGKTQRTSFSANANVLYNDVFSGDILAVDEYLPDDGYVEMYDTNKDGSFDLVRITDYTFIVVGKIAEENEEIYTFYDKFDGNKKIVADTESESVFCKVDGKTVAFWDVKEGDILTLKISKDKQLITGVIGGKKKEGLTSVIALENDRAVLTVENDVFKTTKNYYCESPNANASEILGQNMIFYVNTEGYVLAMEKADIVYNFEYLIAVAKNSLGTKFSMKTYSGSEDKFIIDEITYPVIVDGTLCKKTNDIYDSIMKKGVNHPIMVERSQDGTVKKVDTLYFNSSKEVADESFNRFFPSNQASEATMLFYKTNPGVFLYKTATWEGTGDSKFPVTLNANTKIMFVPIDKSDEDGYFVGTMSQLYNESEYTMEAFATKQTYGYAEYIVVQNDESISLVSDISSQGMAIVCGIKNVYDREIGDEVKKLCYYQNGTYYEKNCEQTVYKYGKGTSEQTINLADIKEGDVIRVQINGRDIIESIYPYCLNKTPMPSDETGYRNNRMMSVFAKYDKSIVAIPESIQLSADGSTSFESIRADSELFRCDKFRVYIYDSSKKEKERVSVSGIDDIYDYVTYGVQSTTKIFINTRLNDPGIMVIYR